MTPEEIIKQIEYLEDENLFRTKIINNPNATSEERGACRIRKATNDHELMHLKSLLASLKGDKFMYGGAYDQ